MRLLTILGARPQFIKAAPVSRILAEAGHEEIVVHTGQHYDAIMSDVFFRDLDLPEPACNLGVGSGPHGEQTARMLMGLESVLRDRRPDWVLLYGDTNSTLAGALAACKLGRPTAHIEAGLRSFNRAMPEEHNRVVTDHVADLLFCPTSTAMDNLAREGLADRSRLVGDTMLDAVRHFSGMAEEKSVVLETLDLDDGGYLLATIHRPYNTDVPDRLEAIMRGLDALSLPVVLPLHPRTRHKLRNERPALLQRALAKAKAGETGLRVIDPVGYLDMLRLLRRARVLVTDSGGMQKEAYCLRVPCLTVRTETEWTETLEQGWNRLCGPADLPAACEERIAWQPPARQEPCFGDGAAAVKIVQSLC